MMHGHEKSDSAIVAMKPPNNVGRPAAEAVERRAGAKENTNRCRTCRTQGRVSVSQAPERVRKAGRPAVNIRGGSRMRASRTYGSVRGALSNGRPYRNPPGCGQFFKQEGSELDRDQLTRDHAGLGA